MGEIVLKITNLNKCYGKRKVIDNLSLEVESGQIYGFLGVNGAGKTTTIKMIVGLASIDSGEVYINGINIKKNHKDAMRSVGAIVENPELYDYLSGMDNLKLYARIHDVNKDRIDDVVKLVGLKDRINDKVKKYSLGMKQRLGLAVSILHKPKLLILDEPTNGLDPDGIKKLRDFLKNMAHKEGVAIFVSSHMLSEMQLMCDRVAIIDKGKIIKVDDIQNLNKNPESTYEILVSDLDEGYELLKNITKCEVKENLLIVKYDGSISKILKVLLDENIEVITCNKKEKSLEEEFLNIVGEK